MTEATKKIPVTRLLEIEELDPRLQEKVRELRQMGGDPSTLRVFGQLPAGIYLPFLEFYGKLRYEGRIDIGLKEIVRMRIAHHNDCQF